MGVRVRCGSEQPVPVFHPRSRLDVDDELAVDLGEARRLGVSQQVSLVEVHHRVVRLVRGVPALGDPDLLHEVPDRTRVEPPEVVHVVGEVVLQQRVKPIAFCASLLCVELAPRFLRAPRPTR